MSEVFGRSQGGGWNDRPTHVAPREALNPSFGKLERMTLVDMDPNQFEEFGTMAPPWNEAGQEGEMRDKSKSLFSTTPALSRVLRIATDTCRSVYNLWSPKKDPKKDNDNRVAMPKLDLDGSARTQASRKRKAANVLELARKARKTKTAVKELEEGFNAMSSKAAKKAMRTTITRVIREARGAAPGPPTVEKLKVLAGVLKQANYRAAAQYLGEYKVMTIEEGHQWSDQLERALKLCKRSANRALGPRKKAKEVPVMETGKEFAPALTKKKPAKVPLAKELFEFGVIWMLREIELAEVAREHLKVEVEHKRVILTIPVSKTDQEAATTTRMLQCLCTGAECSTGCPLRISAMLVFGMEDRGFTYAAVTNQGKRAKKAQLVKEWQKLYGAGTTGHSTRRTGALRYIRHGWAIPQVAYLGRWKSDVIYQYAAEALESLPVNANRAFITNLYGTKETNDAGSTFYKPKDIEEVRDYPLAELSLAAEHQERALRAMDIEVENLKKRNEKNNGRLPPFVRRLGGDVIHHNWNMTSCTPPLAWKTLCGWHYHKSDYMFTTSCEGGKECQKCMEIALLQSR